ncbi:unnamed protein product [Fraxinus pennsylvanica]|uniref:Uncharacterized protein n=1 Tax=Fraxinus pennsylvanica TaxID=56036 RepID=A0AAD1Z1F3_9LAMI|nr:unnamed protein product [Fraxinus pennsylvanica]
MHFHVDKRSGVEAELTLVINEPTSTAAAVLEIFDVLRKLVNETTNIVLDKLSKKETTDAEVIPYEPHEILNSNFERENVKNDREASAVAGEGENFLNLSSMAKVFVEENNSSPDVYEVIEKPDQTIKDACKIQSLKDEKFDNRQEEIITTKETSLEEIQQYADELSSSLDKVAVADRGLVPVEDSADVTSGLKVEDSIHAPDSEDVRIDTSIGETGAENFVSGRNGKMEENFDVSQEKKGRETITFREDKMDATENEREFQYPNNPDTHFLKDAEDSAIQEGNKATTAPEVSKVEDHSIQTSEKVEANLQKQVDESQIKHEECIQNESGKLSSTETPTRDVDHEEIEAGDLGKAEISEDERSSESYSLNEKPLESLHVAPEKIKTSASCQEAEIISHSLEQGLCATPQEILSDETKDKTIDAADTKDVATIEPNKEPGGSIPYYSTNDSKVTHQLKEGKENDGPSIDTQHNHVNNSNICSKGGGNQINSLDDLDDSKASHEVTEDQSKETEIQVDAAQKMTSTSDDIETQMMDKERDTTILSEATVDKLIKICQETTELEVTHSSESIERKKDLNITNPLEEGKDNDGPSIDAPVNTSDDICSKGERVNQINSLKDPDDSEASREVTEDQIKETETQVNDDQKMTSKPDGTETQMMEREHDNTTLLEATADETIKIGQEMNGDQKMTTKPDDIETQMMDREHETTIQSDATADEPTKICQETTELEVTYSSENIKGKKDLNVIHPLEEGKDNDGPLIDAPVNNSNNICSKEGGDQINSLEDPDDSEASHEVTEDQIKETETQVDDDQKQTSKPDETETQMIESEHDTTNQSKATADETIKIGQEMNDDQKMTSKSDDIETQMMDRDHDTTVQSEATADEPIKICQETTELEDSRSSENIEKIIQLDENRNQHVSVASILEEKVAERFEEERNKIEYPSKEVEDSYPVDDGCVDNSTQIINADSGAKDNFSVLTAEKTETGVSFEQENEMNTGDVATIKQNEATGSPIPYCSANDLNVIHLLEEGKDKDGPSIDVPVSNNSCIEGGRDQINGLEDQDDSEALPEVTEYWGKETESQVTDEHKMTSETDDIETQRMDMEHNTTVLSEATIDETIKILQEVNEDQKMTSTPDDIEMQMMDKEYDSTIQSEVTADEAKICHETTQIEVTHPSETIENIILLDENRNQRASTAFILEEKISESFEGDKTINDIPSQQVGVSYQGHDGCIDNSTQIIKDSGAKENLTVLSAEEMETGVPCEEEKKMEGHDTEIFDRRLQSQDTDQHIMMETDGFKDNFTAEENSAKESFQEDEGSKESKSVEAELSTREVLDVVAAPSSAIEENKLDETLKINERNVTISEQEIKNTEKEGTGENFEGTHFSVDNKVKTLEHEEASNTTSTIQSSIQSEEEDMSSKDCLDFTENLSTVSGLSESGREDIIDATELEVIVGTEDPNLKEFELLDKVQLDENDLASEELGVATSKPDKKEAESIDIESECERISNLGENRDVYVSMMGGNEAKESVTGEITKYEVENETQAALLKYNDQVAVAGNVSQNTFNLNLEESYNPSYEEQNLLPVSCNETKHDNSGSIEGSSSIPDSSSALKTAENIDIEKAVVGQEDTARNADDFLKENLDTKKTALELNMEHGNRMEDLDINSQNSMTEKNLESVEPSKEPPPTSELVIEFQDNKSNSENTITAVVEDGIKATEEMNEPIGEVLISQHSLDGTVDTNDDGREHGEDGEQHIDSIQEFEKANECDKTTEHEEKVIEQDFESSQREASCEKKIQLGADDTINRTPDCDQIITGGSLSEEIVQVQRENENTDSEEKIKDKIEEDGCPEDVQMIAVAYVAMHEKKSLDLSSIKNLLSDNGKEKISRDIAEGLNQNQEKSSVTEVPEDEKLANITSLASIARKENCDYKVVQEPTSFHDETDTEDVQVLDDSIAFSLKENPVQLDPEESTELLVPCGEKVKPAQQDPITVLEEIEEQSRNACESVYEEKMSLDIAEDLNLEQEELPVTIVSKDEKLANTTSLASVATEENSDPKLVHEQSSFHDKIDTEVVKVLDDSIKFSLKDNPVPVYPEESTKLQVPLGGKVESMQQDAITVLEEFEEQPRNISVAAPKENMTLDIDEDFNREQEELSVTKVLEDETLANITSLASVATEENSDHKIVPEPSSFRDKNDAEDVQELDDGITISSKNNIVQVDPEESTELQVPHGEKVESMQQDPVTVLVEIEEEQPRNTSEAVSEEKMTLDINENLNQEQEELSVTKVLEDEKLAKITSLASVTIEENSDHKIVPKISSFHDKSDAEDVQVLDDAVTISSKENIVQVDQEESTELQVPRGEKVESMQQDPITVLEGIEEQPRSTAEAVSKENITPDIAEDLDQEQEESSVTEVPEDTKLANMTRLASVATEKNSDCKIVNESSCFQDRTDTEDLQVLDDSITFSTESLVQVDPRESTELQVPCQEKVEAMRQDPISVPEEIEEQQPINAFEAISEAKGVICEGAKRTTHSCEEITGSSSLVELDEISPYNSLQESRKETLQMGEDKGTEKQQDNLHTLAHTKELPVEITQKDAQLYVARADGSEDTGVMEKLVAASLPASVENMVEEAEFAKNSISNKNTKQLKQEDTSETFLTDVKNMRPAEEPEEAKCGQEKMTVGETIESRKESTSIEIAKISSPDFLQLYSMETSHAEDHSTKEKELHAEKVEPIEDEGAKSQEKDEEEEAGNQKKTAVDVAIHEEKGLDSSSMKNLDETNLDDRKDKITRDISDNINREQEELSVTTMSEDEKPVNMISLASKAIEENSESNSFHDKTDSKDLQVLEDSITCSNKENIVHVDPKESIDQDPSEEKAELMQQDPVTVLEEIEEQQTGNASETVSDAKRVNSEEGEKGITDNCEELVASSSFVAIDETSNSNPLLESRTEILQEGEEKETENQQNSIHILARAIDSTMEITQEDAPLCIASADGSDDHQIMQKLEVVSLLALDKNVVDEANYEETSNVEDHSTKENELTINKEELREEKTEPIEDKGAKAHEEEAGKSKRSDFGSQALTLVEERDKDVSGSVSEAPDEDLKVEGEADKFADKADTTPSTVMKKEMSVEEICDNEKSINSRDETPEITNATSDDLEGQEVESARVVETSPSVPQSETVEAQNAYIGIVVVEHLESSEVEFADEENKAGSVYKSNDQNVEELKSSEFPTLTKNNAENSEKKTDKGYEKGFETKYGRADAVIEDNITCDQVKKELPEKPLELLSKVQLFDNKFQSTENNNHGANEEGLEHGDEASKDEDSLSNSTIKEEVDNVVDSNLEILQPEMLEKVLESETQVQSFEVITEGGQTKTEEENLEAAKEEIRNGEIVAEEIFEAKESEKIDISSEKTKDEAEAVEDCQLGSSERETIPERYQEGEEKPEEYLKVKTEAIKSTNEKVSGNFEKTFVNKNVSEHIVLDDKAVEEPKESIDGIFQVKEEEKIAEGITTIVNNQEKAHKLDDVYVETGREILSEEEQVVLSAREGEVTVGEADSCSRQTEDGNEKPDFSSHSKDTSEISHSGGVLGIAKENENSAGIRMLEKIFTGMTKSEISELAFPNESVEAITSTVSKDIQSMEQDSEAITVNAEMHESKAGTASCEVQEATGVQSREEEKAKDDYKEMTGTSTSMECAISTSKIKHGSAVETPAVVEDHKAEDKLVELHHLTHLHHIQDSEGKTEEDGPVDLQRASNITEDIQELDERSIALSNKENLAETDPNGIKEHNVSSRGEGVELIQRDLVQATLQQEIENQQPGNSSEAVSEAKDAICEEEKGSASEAAQGTKDKNTPTKCHELPVSSDVKYPDMEKTHMDVESWVERVDGIDVTNVMQNLDATSVPASDKQTVIDAYHTKNAEFFNSTVDNKYMPRLQQDAAEIFLAEGEIPKPSELEQEGAKYVQEERTADETIESTKKSVSTEIANTSISDLQGSLKEPSEMADHHPEGRETTEQKEELKAEKTEEAEHEEKSDEEKDNHEESSEQKGSDLGSEAPVLVDAGDVVTKVSHKKSHNILSGVGSKVKHSIAKVKRAIIGKSSHPKPPSPKESEKC